MVLAWGEIGLGISPIADELHAVLGLLICFFPLSFDDSRHSLIVWRLCLLRFIHLRIERTQNFVPFVGVLHALFGGVFVFMVCEYSL